MARRKSADGPPAMSDVAAVAGVSHQTVSRVVNGSDKVADETRRRVEDAISTLGYRRNLSARALATRRSGLIGIVAAGFPHMGPASTVGAIEMEARSRGYTTVVGVLRDPVLDDPSDLFDSLLEHGVQGVVVVAPHESLAERARAVSSIVPTVLVADLARQGDFHVVAVDQPYGARLATQYLIDRGLRRIVHISGPRRWFDAETRIRGWSDTLRDNGLAVPELLEGDWGPDLGYTLGRRLVAGPLPDADFCATDLTAVGLCAALREAGVRVPEDVAVVGYDDIEGARYLDPALTTVRQPFQELGERCVEVLLAAIDGAPPSHHALQPTLVVRSSTP